HEVACVGEQVLVRRIAMLVERVTHPDRALRIGVCDVQRAFIRRERDAVRKRERGVDEVHAAVRIEAVDAIEVELLERRVVQALEPVRRIGEEDRALALAREVVRAVEALAGMACGERVLALRRKIEPRNDARAGIGQQERAVTIGVQSIRARLAKSCQPRTRVAGRLEEYAQALGLRPAIHLVLGYIREQQVSAWLYPCGTLRPRESV